MPSVRQHVLEAKDFDTTRERVPYDGETVPMLAVSLVVSEKQRLGTTHAETHESEEVSVPFVPEGVSQEVHSDRTSEDT